MNFTITVDDTEFMPNDIPKTESTPTETYTVEITTVDEVRKKSDKHVHHTGGVN